MVFFRGKTCNLHKYITFAQLLPRFCTNFLACVFLVKSMYFTYILNGVFSGKNMQFTQILDKYSMNKALYFPQILHENSSVERVQ